MARLMLILALLCTPLLAHADPISVTIFFAEMGLGTLGVLIADYGMYALAFSAMYVYSGAQRRKAERAARDAMRDRTVMIRSSEAPHNVVYGQTRVSGPVAYACTSGTNSEFLHLVVVLAAHEINSVEAIWINDEVLGTLDANGWVTSGVYAKNTTEALSESFTVPSGGVLTLSKAPVAIQSVVTYAGDDVGSYSSVAYTQSGSTVTVTAATGATCVVTYTYASGVIPMVRVKKFLGTSGGARDTDLETASGGAWTSAHLGKNVARLHITLQYDQDIFPSGIPNISAVVKGRKIYDPRTGTTVWSNNPALCVRDYLVSAAGFGATSSEIDDTLVTTAANICDELVNYDATNTHARYTCDGAFTLDAARREILQDLLGAMVGTAAYSGGKWLIRAGAYVTPTLDLTDSDLADGAIQVQARTARRDLFNSVRGQFIDPSQKYAIVDFPPYASSTYATEDNGEVVYQDIALPFTANVYRAQRIAKLILYRARQALVMQATWKLPAYALQPSDTARLTIARYGWTNKVFRVVDREYAHPHQVKLTLQEEASAIYAWSYSEATVPDAAPNTDLPDPRVVPSIAGLAVASGATKFRRLADGTTTPIARISWSAVADAGVTQGGSIEVRSKRAWGSAWDSQILPGTATQCDIDTAAGEILNVAVRAVNGTQVRGPWTFVTHTVSSAAPATGTAATTGGGGNLIRNAALRYDAFPWSKWIGSGGEAATWTFSHIDATDTYAPRPYGALKFQSPALASTFSGFATGCPATYMSLTDGAERIGVVAGGRYEAQIRCRTVNGRSQLTVLWYDIAGSLISYSIPTGGVSVSTNYSTPGQASLSNYSTPGQASRSMGIAV